MAGFFITGTDTEVGKTIITTCLTYALRESGMDVIPYKPVQSGAEQKNGLWVSPDVTCYQSVLPEEEKQLYSYLLKPSFSPHLAAQIDGISIDPQKIVEDFRSLKNKHEQILVEGAGGLAVPIVDEHYCTTDLIKHLNLPLIIVARPALGTINHTVLTVKYAESLGLPVAGIILNGYHDQPTLGEQDNPGMIEKMTGVKVIGKVPYVEGIENRLHDQTVLDQIIEYIDINFLLEQLNTMKEVAK